MDLSQNAALSASLDVGTQVIRQLATVGKVHKRSVQQANLAVLRSPDVPSILIETGFISNPQEEKNLNTRAHQERVAGAILAGIRNYFVENPPANTQLALDLKRKPAEPIRHVIVSGDTLSEIAARYSVSLRALRSANNLSTDRVRIGQTLKIPLIAGI